MTNTFWQDKSLAQLSRDEWEQLCDGCGKCCLHKLEDEDTGELYFTRVACRLFDDKSCRCKDYANRLAQVPECLHLSLEDEKTFQWLPSSCAYRLLYEGKPLPDWHPLVCGNQEDIHRRQQSVRGRVISENFVHPEGLEEHIVSWVE